MRAVDERERERPSRSSAVPTEERAESPERPERMARVLKPMIDEPEPRERPVIRPVDNNKRQTLLMEYEILDSFWTHQHQWIWTSAMVLIGLSMLGLTFLPVGLVNNPLRNTFITFVSGIAVLLVATWWGLLRHMLGSLRVAQHRKIEIEKMLGMRMELYLAFARHGRGRQRVREMVQEEAGDDAELRADLADFLRSPGMKPCYIPGEEWAWNFLPVLFLGAWVSFWVITVIL